MFPARNFGRFFNKALKQPIYALKVGWKRLVAGLSYKFGDGRASYPESVTIFLTHRCNLRCKMCGQWGEGGVTRQERPELIREEMNQVELNALIDGMSDFKPNITLFGGEPFLHTRCLEVIERIKMRGMHCLVITNGFMVEELADKLVAIGLDELNVSLDGARDLHDQIRGCPGLFDKIMGGLKKIHSIKASRNLSKPLVNLQCTITKYNYKRLPEMLAVARDAGADSLTFHNLIFLDEGILAKQASYDIALGSSSAEWRGFLFSPGIDVDELWRIIKKIKMEKQEINVDFYPNFNYMELVEYYKHPDRSPAGQASRCMSPWVTAYIFPDGEMRPCLNSTYSYGNVKDKLFKGVWNSSMAVKFRSELKKAGAFPVCARCTELYRY